MEHENWLSHVVYIFASRQVGQVIVDLEGTGGARTCRAATAFLEMPACVEQCREVT